MVMTFTSVSQFWTSHLLTELREPSFEALVHRGRVFTCNTWNLFISLKFSFTKNVAQNKVTGECVYTQLQTCAMIRVSPAARYKEEWCFIPNVENVEVGVSLGQFAVDGWQSWENDFIAFILGKKNDICACLQRKAAAERAPAASWCICYGWSLPCTILDHLWRNLVPLLLLYMEWF